MYRDEHAKLWKFEIQEVGDHPELGTSARMFGTINQDLEMSLRYLGKSSTQNQVFAVNLTKV